MSKGLVTRLIGMPLPAEGELTPRALTSLYTTLRVRLPKRLNISGLARHS